MGKIMVLTQGFLTTIQDGGRIGFQQYGVPVSGVMDRYSYRIANILVGNDEEQAVLEITMLGPKLKFTSPEIIAITGGDLSPMINGKQIPMYRSVKVNKGDILAFGELKNGCRSYIAFTGGIDVPIVMGSRSTYLKGKIGGYRGRELNKGDIVDIINYDSEYKVRLLSKKHISIYENKIDIRVVLGPQNEYFTKHGIDTFLSDTYTITNECDRMGFRLDGAEIEHINGADIISDGIEFGAIQISGNGKPIIMMADRQTTGGYTKIANVISVDLPKIAQAKPGDKISFKVVSIKEAQDIYVEEENKLKSIEFEVEDTKIVKQKELIIRVNSKKYEVNIIEYE
ncbi:biotin-dependent carboxyltransferase family protein [Clostridiaceae bacterium M8S5]|nr:biotin-dependent carboxyltransferase family protein [Clostridiaceae bacterium M8S5]